MRPSLHSLWLVLLLIVPVTSAAQDSGHESQQPDSGLTRVLLIPYDPLYYLSDADREIIEQTDVEPSRIYRLFRDNIDYYIQRRVSSWYPCISALNDADSIPSLEHALGLVYSTTGYRYDNPMPLPYKEERMDTTRRKKNPLLKNAHDSRIAAQYLPSEEDAKYMNAVIRKPEVLQELYETYGTNVFIFVNQFEIKTDYSSCFDIAKKIYRREVLVHFSVFNRHGKQTAGACVAAPFPSDSNNAYEIIRNCFPDLASYISMCTP